MFVKQTDRQTDRHTSLFYYYYRLGPSALARQWEERIYKF